MLRRRAMMMRQDAQTDILYKIPAPTEFDGVDDYIDTGIKLYDVSGNWTIFFIADLSQTTEIFNNNSPVFHCIYEISPWPGISFQRSDLLSVLSYTGANGSDYTPTRIDKLEGEKYYQGCIVCENGIVTRISDKRTDTVDIRSLFINKHTINEDSKKATLLLGCYQDVNGTKGRFWKGTIYDFIVYGRALSENEANKLFQ